jgi:hypothetical protein
MWWENKGQQVQRGELLGLFDFIFVPTYLVAECGEREAPVRFVFECLEGVEGSRAPLSVIDDRSMPGLRHGNGRASAHQTRALDVRPGSLAETPSGGTLRYRYRCGWVQVPSRAGLAKTSRGRLVGSAGRSRRGEAGRDYPLPPKARRRGRIGMQ